MTVTSSHPLHLLWGERQNHPPVTILPRVNGDGTVTLLLLPPGPSSAGREGVMVLRHVAPGQGAVVLSRTLGAVLVVEVREVLPAAAGH